MDAENGAVFSRRSASVLRCRTSSLAPRHSTFSNQGIQARSVLSPQVDNHTYILSHLDFPLFLFPLTIFHFYKMRSKKLRQGDSDCVVLCSSVPLFWIADTFLGSLCVPCLYLSQNTGVIPTPPQLVGSSLLCLKDYYMMVSGSFSGLLPAFNLRTKFLKT